MIVFVEKFLKKTLNRGKLFDKEINGYNRY